MSHGKQSLRFICHNNHNFYSDLQCFNELYAKLFEKNGMISGDDLQAINWCTKCQNFQAKVYEVARRSNLEIVGGLYTSHLQMKCTENHYFKITY